VLELWDYGRPSGLPNQPISLSEARHRSPRSFAISGRCDATTRVGNCSETRGRRRPRSASPLPHWAKPNHWVPLLPPPGLTHAPAQRIAGSPPRRKSPTHPGRVVRADVRDTSHPVEPY
jgi:hypothetical protein